MKTFEVMGELWLMCQEGSAVSDSFELVSLGIVPEEVYGPKGNYLRLPFGTQSLDLADSAAAFFDVEREPTSGDRYVGPVRITIERLPWPTKG